ncbi:hypothetical protein H920_01087 [Fukomys damarensis]|uniref:Uncharacterized protein n=1 Tax=Fukomys damarensis TaxID=885580 RepID=A0A091E430_FUKDA|nr:hypothetical protein H920_01087 [Fukomys damarensis]
MRLRWRGAFRTLIPAAVSTEPFHQRGADVRVTALCTLRLTQMGLDSHCVTSVVQAGLAMQRSREGLKPPSAGSVAPCSCRSSRDSSSSEVQPLELHCVGC